MVRTIDTYGPSGDRTSGVSGFDGSHGRSHVALRTRISRHVRASETRTGRSTTGASSRSGSVMVAGHPRIRPTVVYHSPERHLMRSKRRRLALRNFRGTLRLPV